MNGQTTYTDSKPDEWVFQRGNHSYCAGAPHEIAGRYGKPTANFVAMEFEHPVREDE